MKLGRTLVTGLLAAFLAAPVFANETPAASADQTQAQAAPAADANAAQASNPVADSSKEAAVDATKHEDAHHSKSHEHKADKTAKANTQPVNINTASVEQFKSLKGIGQKRAEAIVKYRDANGNFASVDDLSKVKGVSQKWLEKNRSHLTTADASSNASEAG